MIDDCYFKPSPSAISVDRVSYTR